MRLKRGLLTRTSAMLRNHANRASHREPYLTRKRLTIDAHTNLSHDELLNAFDSLGLTIPDAELRTMIAEMDTDGDGTIDLEEFQSMILQVRGRVKVSMKKSRKWLLTFTRLPCRRCVG